MRTLIKNATTASSLLDKPGIGFEEVHLILSDGIIEEIYSVNPDGSDSEPPSGEFDETVDARNLFLSPGLCDPQVHFREPGLEYKEDIESGSRAAVKGGFTTVISMPNTTPVADSYETVKFMWDKQKEIGLCQVYPTGAVSKGLLGKELADFEKLKEAGAIALTDDGKGVQSAELFEQALFNAKKVNLPVLDHSEDESLSLGGAIHAGEKAQKYNIAGIDPDSESEHVRRGCLLAEKTGAHYHVLHVSTKKSIDFVRDAKARGLSVTAEVSPHHLLLSVDDIPERADGTLDANWKMNPPLRSSADREACQLALVDGTIDAIATDHAPHAPDEKAMSIEKAPFGIIGLETAFPIVYTHFVRTNKIKLDQCIDLMSRKAGELFGLRIGRISKGVEANLALFDLENKFEVTEDFFASKSKNSPFIGQTLYGKTIMTFFEGKKVYESR